MANVVISGGTGFVGGYVIDALLDAGHTVAAIVRQGEKAPRLEDKGVKLVTGDVLKYEGLEAACAGADAVIHLVGIIRERPGAGFEEVHVTGTVNMLRAARAARVKRFIHMSALGTRKNCVSRYHKTKWQGEEAVRASGIPYVIFRPSVIFGPGDEFLNKLKTFFRNPLFVPVIGNGKPLLQPVYAGDVGKCFARAVVVPEAENRVLEIGGPSKMTIPQLLDVIGHHLGKRRLKIKIPIFLMNIVAALMEKFMDVPEITRDQLIMLQEDNATGMADESGKILGVDFTPLESIIPSYL